MLRILTEEDHFEITDADLTAMRKRQKLTLRKRDPFGELVRPTDGPSDPPSLSDGRLIARVKELWAQSLGQAEMLKVLTEEDGWHIDNKDLVAVRTKHGLKLRSQKPWRDVNFPNALSHSNTPGTNQATRTKRGRARHSTRPDGKSSRFPSELTVEEARAVVGLSFEQYQDMVPLIKQLFETEAGELTKKTEIGPEKWKAMKHQLISGTPRLREVMVGSEEDLEEKHRALDIICSQIGKRLRISKGRMGLPEARTILGMDPEASRRCGAELFRIFLDIGFVKKSDLSPEEWDEITGLWADRCKEIKEALAVGPRNPDYARTSRALKTVAKSVMGRFQSEAKKMAPDTGKSQLPTVPPGRRRTRPGDSEASEESSESEQQQDDGWGAEPISDDADSDADPVANALNEPMVSHEPAQGPQTRQRRALQGSQGNVQANMHSQVQQPVQFNEHAGSMRPAMNSHMTAPSAESYNSQYSNSQYYQQQSLVPQISLRQNHQHQQHTQRPMAAFMRLNPASSLMPTNSTLWVAAMQSASVAEVHRIAVQRYPGSQCSLIEGIVKDGFGTELPLRIDQDVEMQAYLEHLQGAAPTFSVLLS